MALCGGYVAVQAELEVLVLKLDASSEPEIPEDSLDTNKGCNNTVSFSVGLML